MPSLGVLSVTLTANTKNFQRDIKGAKRSISSIRGTIGATTKLLAGMAAGFLSFHAVRGAIRGINDEFTRLDQVAKKAKLFGMDPQQLLVFHEAAKLTGASVEVFNKGLQNMVRQVAEAAIGPSEIADTLVRLELSAKRLARMSIAEIWFSVAEAMEGVTLPADRLLKLYRLLGGRGTALGETMRFGRKRMEELGKAMKEKGELPTMAMFRSVERANDAVSRMKTSFTRLTQTLVREAAPIIEKIALAMAEIDKSFKSTDEKPGFLKKLIGIAGPAISRVNFAMRQAGAVPTIRGTDTFAPQMFSGNPDSGVNRFFDSGQRNQRIIWMGERILRELERMNAIGGLK